MSIENILLLNYTYGEGTQKEQISESEARTIAHNRDEILDRIRTGRIENEIQGKQPYSEGVFQETPGQAYLIIPQVVDINIITS